MVFYHGTTDIIPIEDNILLPANITGIQRESRLKHIDVVFLTNSKCSAKKFASKACFKYGGNPVVYECEPIGDVYHINTNEYICDNAYIIK